MGDGAHDAGAELGRLLGLSEFLVQPGEFFFQDLFVSEDPDHLLSRNGLLGKGVDHAQGRLLGPVGRPASFDDLSGDPGQDGCRQDGNGPQDQIGIEHKDHCPRQGNGARNDLDQGGVEHLSHRIDVVGIAAHQVSRLVGIEIGYRQALHPGKKVCPKPAQGLLGDLEHEAALQVLGRHGQKIKDGQKGQSHGKATDPACQAAICGVIVDKAVDDGTQQIGQGKRRDRIGRRTDKGQDQKDPFSRHIVPEPSDDPAGVRRLSGGQKAPVPGDVVAHVQLRGPSSGVKAASLILFPEAFCFFFVQRFSSLSF